MLRTCLIHSYHLCLPEPLAVPFYFFTPGFLRLVSFCVLAAQVRLLSQTPACSICLYLFRMKYIAALPMAACLTAAQSTNVMRLNSTVPAGASTHTVRIQFGKKKHSWHLTNTCRSQSEVSGPQRSGWRLYWNTHPNLSLQKSATWSRSISCKMTHRHATHLRRLLPEDGWVTIAHGGGLDG